MVTNPQEKLYRWKRLKRSKHLTDEVAQCVCTWTMLGFSLERITEGGSNEQAQLNAAQRNELPVIEQVRPSGTKAKLRPPSKHTILKWIAEGQKDESAGVVSDKSQFAFALARAREMATDAGYDEIIEIERRMLAPHFIPNPDYDENDKKSKRMMVNPAWLDATTGTAIIRSIQWRLGKLKPERYGERIDINAKIQETKSISIYAPPWLSNLIGSQASEAVDRAKLPVLEARTPTTSSNGQDG